jgi:tetratricopeptide (TPR) repeat protein
MTDRIDSILAMLQRTPDDVFLNYSLGMEYAAAGRHDEAAEAFATCTRLDADYLPAYTEGGKALRAAGRLNEAREVFTRAASVAGRLKNSHALDFIQAQLQSLGTP